MTNPDHPGQPSEPPEPSVPLEPPPPSYAAAPPYAPPALNPVENPYAAYGQAPMAPYGHAPVAPPQPGRNVLGNIALALAIVGTVLGLVPLLFLGWLPLGIAFVLALIALFRPARKGTALAALIVSIVGAVVSIVGAVISVVVFVFAALLFSVGSGYEQSSDVSVEGGSSPGAPAEGQTEGPGTRADPLPLGSTVSSEDWSVTVNSVTFDATDAVLAESDINEAPADGEEYVLVDLTTAYVGEEQGYPAEVQVEYVTADGVGINGYDSIVLPPEALEISATLYPGGSASGNVAFVVPSGTAEGGVLSIQPGILTDTVFVAVR